MICVRTLHKTASVFIKDHLLPEIKKNRIIKYNFERDFDISNMKTDDFYIFVLRHPLDILVSEYYSFGWIHSLHDNAFLKKQRPKIQEMTVNEYCLWGKYGLLQRIEKLPVPPRKNCLYLTYEEMVLDFPKWLKKFCEPLNVKNIDPLVEIYQSEFQVEETTPEEILAGKIEHKRKITPGDHKCKLKQETIDILKHQFNDFLVILQFVNPEYLYL